MAAAIRAIHRRAAGNTDDRMSVRALGIGEPSEARCECGQLVAKLRRNGVELKCKRCKRIVVIPYARTESATLLSNLPA